MDTGYRSLDDHDEQLFQKHAKGIDNAVREVFSSIPADFQLKPATVKKTQGCGVFYDFKVALPDGQFARVSFHMGGYPVERAPGEPEPEKTFRVDPTPSSSAN